MRQLFTVVNRFPGTACTVDTGSAT